MQAHDVPAECVRIMHRRRGRQHDMMSSETFYDIDKWFVKQHKLIAVVHISLIATVSCLMSEPHGSTITVPLHLMSVFPGQQHKAGYRRFSIHAKCFPVALQ